MENTKLRSKTLNLEADPGPLILPIVRTAPTKSGSNSALQCEINPDPVLILVVSSRSSSSTMTTKYTSRDQAAPWRALLILDAWGHVLHQDQKQPGGQMPAFLILAVAAALAEASRHRDQTGSAGTLLGRAIISDALVMLCQPRTVQGRSLQGRGLDGFDQRSRRFFHISLTA